MHLQDVLESTARRKPASAALFWNGGAISFSELEHRVFALAGQIRALAAAGSRVAILAENSPDYVVACYAVPAACCTLVLLNCRLHQTELQTLIVDAGAIVLLYGRDFSDIVAEMNIPSVSERIVLGADARPGTGFPAPIPPKRADDELQPAWILYTSGTTGTAKGVVLTHRNLLASIRNSASGWPLREDDVAVSAVPLCHVSAYFIPLLHSKGCPIVLHRSFDPDRFLQDIETHRATIALLPAKERLLESPLIDRADFSSLRMLMYGGGRSEADVLNRLRTRFGNVLKQAYGMTEAAGNVAMLQPEELPDLSEPSCEIPTGRAMPLCRIRIADDQENEVALGEVGEVLISGEQVASGYWNAPEQTARVFGGGWLRTGDMARRERDGLFTVVDRKKDMIKSGGQNVVSLEVETVLESHPAVAQAAVIGVPDPRWGEAVTAIVVLRTGVPATDADLIRYCKERIAGFKCPKRILFRSDLPRNATGKVLKTHLRGEVAASTTP